MIIEDYDCSASYIDSFTCNCPECDQFLLEKDIEYIESIGQCPYCEAFVTPSKILWADTELIDSCTRIRRQ